MRHELWPLISGLLVFLGLLTSDGLLLIVGSLVGVVWLSARVWERYCFRGVEFDRSISPQRAFIGDTLQYTVSLTNDKPLPLIWIEAQDPFPNGLELADAVVRGATLETNRHHSIVTSLLPYQRATWRFSLSCAQRGYHRIGPVRLRSGDIFGFVGADVRLTGVDDVLVYPRVIDLPQFIFPPHHPFGIAKGVLPLNQDASRVRGVRDYRFEDPMKHIDWKASARARGLKTRVFEPVVSLNVVVALNGSTSDYSWLGANSRLFERAITAAASTISLADRLGYSYGLLTNAVAAYSGKWISVPIGASPRQLPLTLESLAMAAPFVVSMLPDVLRAERDNFPDDASVVLVTSFLSDRVAAQLDAFGKHGNRISVIFAGDGEPPESIGGYPVIGIGHLLDDPQVEVGTGPNEDGHMSDTTDEASLAS